MSTAGLFAVLAEKGLGELMVVTVRGQKDREKLLSCGAAFSQED